MVKSTSTSNRNHTLPGSDDITRVQLSNEIVVLTRPNHNSPSIVISGYLHGGGLYDPDDKLGLANFTSLALMRGTNKRNFQEIYDTLESAGASLGFNSAVHTASFGGKCLAEDLDMILSLLSETLRQPGFPTEQVERLRTQLLTSLAIRGQDTHEMAALTFDEIVYDNHPYSRPPEGYLENVQAITRDDLDEFYKTYYGPQGMVIAVVGDIKPAKAVKMVDYYLGDWKNPEKPDIWQLPSLKPLEATRSEAIKIPGKSQADIVLGVAGPERRSPDYLAAALGNSVLGQFGLMGRIGDVVREQAGLAYHASSSLGGGIGPGPWSISAGVDPMNVDKTIDIIRKEIGRFVSEPVSEDELSDSQANFTGRLPLSLESNGGVAGALLNLERYELGLNYYRGYSELIRAVTVEDVLETAQRYLHADRLGIAVAGP